MIVRPTRWRKERLMVGPCTAVSTQ